MQLKIITTGGTLDKVYFDALSTYEVGAPVVGALLKQYSAGIEWTLVELFRKDSLDITDADRERINAEVQRSTQQRILITHGTDTMIETAKSITAPAGTAIALTGALQPAAFSASDAAFNIGCAIGALQKMASGVCLVVGGVVYDPTRVRKDRELGRFVAID